MMRTDGRNVKCVRAHIVCYSRFVPKNDDVAAWAALLRAQAAVLPRLEQALTKVGLPLTWYDVLLVVNAAPERRLTMSELGRQAVVSRERVSRVVTDLVEVGLVERLPNPDDRRSAYAAITAEGRRRLRAAAPVYLAAVDEHFLRHLRAPEISTVTRALGRVVQEEEARARH